MFLRLLVILFLVAACGRPLTETEKDFAARIHGDALDLDRVRLVEGAPVGSVTFQRKPRPRVTCRERILPPVKEEIVTSKPAAVALFNHVLFTRDWYLEDYAQEYPDRLHLVQAMLFAHELTHVWQWQNRRKTGYHPLRAAAEHGRTNDPYLFDLDETPNFLDYGFEQQGTIVEEYVCCRALAPDAARTARLHKMLSAAFPVSDLPKVRESDVYLPWDGVEIEGICD
ncbi:hypothetical protein Q5Y75_11660 [Ruegeria sp. 2205SS24-7]|uniref:hypothetical protein n=1 Tax=Ruegeria discodermiae TaxID=3064389 RepID=UPI0027414681|nr:hypothetical protein [Ruegeria sp. 2205SS24-7]MDP5217876.1 hypothetical protein [Ruegeria sp. 2205SS24-7]